MTPLLAFSILVSIVVLACLAAFAAYLLDDTKPEHVSESDWQRITFNPQDPACIHHVDQRAQVIQKERQR